MVVLVPSSRTNQERSLSPPRRRFRGHRIQQHVAAGGQVGGLGVLDLVVADAADAGYEIIALGATRAMYTASWPAR